ncbi:MAG: lamin tail domain-containing protein, partial [Myxococcales bacterium]|nr:lamin tail domain-containing protein [Myxococcales bacterium]
MKWSVFLPIFYFCNNNISRWPHIAAFWRNHPGLAVLSTLISLCAVPHTGYAICLSPPGDVTGDGLTSVTDVQCNILANLWSLGGLVATPPACLNTVGSPAILPDHNCDGVINVSDTLMAVTFALYQPLSAELDNNGNQCVDACEIDTDADGDYDLSDCAPQNPTIHHGAVEICNGYDDNCNNDTDESGSSVTASCATTSACVTDGICGVQPTVTGLIITEIHHSPGVVEDSVGEWFEVYNAGTLPVNIQGFVLTDLNNEFHKVDAGGALFIPAKGYFVFGRNKNPANNGGVRVHYEYTGLGFSSISDTLAILDPSGTQLAKVTYSAAGGYPLVPGKSLALKSLPEPPLVAGSWAASSWSLDNGDWATPGGPNVDVIPSACEEGAPVVCDDQNPCTDDVCDDVAGCVNTFNTAPCAAVDPCVSTATCTQGVCVGGTSVSCDDSNPCTKDTCQAGVGCLHQATAGGCEDGDACTFLDVCLNGTCVAGIPTFCDDFNPCTVNSCVPTSGCVYSPTSGLCEDGNGCTELDICLNGICVAGIPKVCNDGNECTVDACHPVLGCVFTPTSGPCTDGNPCTAGDVCVSGKCIGGPAPVCNDFNV